MKRPSTNKQPYPSSPTAWSVFLSLLLVLLALSWTQTAQAQSYVLSNLWSVLPNAGTHAFMTNDTLTRGIAFNPSSGHVLVASRTPTATVTNAIYILDQNNGAILGSLPYDTNVINGGTFVINMLGVTDDGVIYVGNLTTDATNTASGPFKLYRWANETAQPALVYSGDPSMLNTNGASPRRFGDSLAIRGTGTGTQILLGTLNQTVALMTTTDGINFTATKIVTDGAVADTRWGLAWGDGNTFWAKQNGGNLKKFSLNLGAGTAIVVASSPMSSVPGGPLDVDVSRNLVAILGTTNHAMRLYDIFDPALPVQQDTSRNSPGANNNGNGTGAIALRNGKLFVLETQNGIAAYSVHAAYFPPSIATAPVAVTMWEGADNWTFTTAAAGTRPFSYQWQMAGTNLPGETASSLTVRNIGLTNQGLYSVVVTNSSGTVTSSAAMMTVTRGNASAQVENLWNVLPNTRPYVASSYKEYGVAINPLTKNVIVVTRANPTNMIVVLDPDTGAEKHYIDYSGLALSSGNAMNRVDVADDGVIYIANTATASLTIYGIGNDSPSTTDKWIAFKADPGNGLIGTTNGWGGTFAVRGGYLDTEILVGTSTSGNNAKWVAILKPDPSYVFTSTLITVTNAPGAFARLGLAWGSGNTFWAKTYLGNLIQVQYDLASGTGWVVNSYPQTGSRSVPASVTAINYDPTTGLLAGLLNGTAIRPVSVPIYDLTDPGTGPLWADQELFTTHNADIEFQGRVDFAAGYLVALGLNNGLKGFKVNSGMVSLPVIVSHPASSSFFEGTSPTLSVVADSTSAMSYQWYYYGTQAIAGATSPTLTFTNIQATQAGQYLVRVSNAGGYRESLPAEITVLPLHNTAQMTNMWSVQAMTRPYLNNNYYEYGMAFNPANSNLLVVSYIPTNNALIVAVLDAMTGADQHYLDVSTVTNKGNRWLNKIGVADDGVVYAANRTTSGSGIPFVVYRWADDSTNSVATEAFKGDPFGTLYPNKNAGFTMDVRGAGVNTEILVTAYDANVLSILKTTDGTNFTRNEIQVPEAPSKFARLGVCFGADNTIWAKAWVGDGNALRLIRYNLGAGTGTVERTYTDQVSGEMTTVAYNDTLKFLGGISRDDQKNVQLYNVADLDFGPVLLDQEVFPTYNSSIEANGALDFAGNEYLFALNENNGIMAFRINHNYQPPVTHFKVLNVTASGGNVTLTWEAQAGTSYQVQFMDALGGTWQDIGSPVTANGPTASWTNNAPGASQRFYRVVTP